MPQPTDHQLVAAVLEATANLSLREREAKTGISHASFRRFQQGYGHRNGWKILQKGTRAAITDYLQRVGKMPAPVPATPLADVDRARLLELWEEMGRVLRRETA